MVQGWKLEGLTQILGTLFDGISLFFVKPDPNSAMNGREISRDLPRKAAM